MPAPVVPARRRSATARAGHRRAALRRDAARSRRPNHERRQARPQAPEHRSTQRSEARKRRVGRCAPPQPRSPRCRTPRGDRLAWRAARSRALSRGRDVMTLELRRVFLCLAARSRPLSSRYRISGSESRSSASQWRQRPGLPAGCSRRSHRGREPMDYVWSLLSIAGPSDGCCCISARACPAPEYARDEARRRPVAIAQACKRGTAPPYGVRARPVVRRGSRPYRERTCASRLPLARVSSAVRSRPGGMPLQYAYASPLPLRGCV